VDLAVELEPADAQSQRQIERRLAAELRARGVEICTVRPGGMLAHMRVRATPPELTVAIVRVDTEGGGALERSLDFTGLPREARASAIASAADELLSSVLDTASPAASGSTMEASDPMAAASVSPSSVVAPSDTGAGGSAAAPAPSASELPRLALGMGVGAARLGGDASVYSAELLGRWRPLEHLFATVRAGGLRGSVAGGAFEQRSGAWFTGLDAGVELLEPAERFGLAARAGVALARVQRSIDESVFTPVGEGSARRSLGNSWEVAANLGLEASHRAGFLAVTVGVTLLVPLTATAPELPNVTGVSFSVPSDAGFGETFGGQLDLRVWLALDESS
jgi:hypothetical protein